MIVCLIAEGCYPYVSGGVSSWIHQLITGLPEIGFKVFSIMSSNKERREYCYAIPANLLEINTVFLDDYLNLNHREQPKKLSLTAQEEVNLYKLFQLNSSLNWQEIIKLLVQEKKAGTALELLQSEFFWNSILSIYEEKYNTESFNTFFWTIRTMLLPFTHLLQQEPPEADLYHSVSTGYAGIVGATFHELSNKPFLLTEHGIYAREREEEIIKAKWVTGVYKRIWIDFFYFMSVVAYKEADRIIALFKRNQDIQFELGVNKECSMIVANGVNLHRYSPEKELHDGFNIGAILRVVPIKDVMTLIRAFKIVNSHLKQTRLYLIGPVDEDPDYSEQCKNLVQLLKLENDVFFTGRVDVKEYMKKIDIMVLTSISEGQPLVILEGMASGIPLVATDVGSCRELLEEDDHEGPCGLITALVSPNDTAAKIIRLLENYDLRVELGANGRKRVERAYTEELFLSKYQKVYDELR